MNEPGPITRRLFDDLRNEVRRQGIVVWLDKDEHYTAFVDRLAEQRRSPDGPDFAVAGFRGSHLELMLALEDHASGIEKGRLLVHMPGFNEDTIKATPMLELYAAGVRFRKALPTLVEEAAAGQVRPEQIAAFIAQEDLTLEKADAWLAAVRDTPDGELAAQLRAMSLTALLDDLIENRYVASKLQAPHERDVVWDHLAAQTGVTDTWRSAFLPNDASRGADLAFAVTSWALCVEYIHDLKREPYEPRLGAMRDLPKPVVASCRGLASYLREHQPRFYQRTADETEGWLHVEVARAVAADLGKIDTFRFEETRILEAALDALHREDWLAAAAYAEERAQSFWLDEPTRKAAWSLVESCARLGTAVANAGRLANLESLAQAVDAYVLRGVEVDRAHRLLEQRRAALLQPQLPLFETIRAQLDELRVVWRRWADAWARDFNRLCLTAGFLPDTSLQQRFVFDDVVRPLVKPDETTAYFLVDALRYEMADELREAFSASGATTVTLKPRLAELPTISAVGMNCLAPVVTRGRLRPVLSGDTWRGFQTGEFQVLRPDTRKRAMQDRAGGSTCPWMGLTEVLERSSTSLRQAVARAKLIVVHSLEIDSAGEQGVGPAAFDTILRDLRAAWQLLREAGVRQFVFTSDHGFLLLGDAAADLLPHGRKVDPHRRYVLSNVPADHTGEVRVPLSELGYDGVDDVQLMMPETTALFDTGSRGSRFAHGGNTLQERVIPVLTVTHRADAGVDTLRYEVEAEAREGVMGMQCVGAKVVAAKGQLDFGGRRDVELSLRVVDGDGVTVELCQTREGARLVTGAVSAQVGSPFELFFRLTAQREQRVLVELCSATGSSAVTPCRLDGRFPVIGSAVGAERVSQVGGEPSDERPKVRVTSRKGWTSGDPKGPEEASTGSGWLDTLPEGGVRRIFGHLQVHGSINEKEATAMLGSGFAFRKFSREFEKYAAQAPFVVRIESVNNTKRYVREGSAS